MMDFLMQLLLIGGIAFLVSTLALGLTTWLVVRKVRRSGVIHRTRENGLMTARTLSGDSSIRRLATLRRNLQRSTQATARSLAAAGSAGHPLGDLPAVAADLERAHVSLQESIRIAEEEPDRQVRVSHATRFSKQAETLNDLSAQLRQSLLQLSDDVGTGAVQDASAHLKLEVAGLKAWSTTYTSAPRNRTTAA